ncbi:hypothetical protein ACTFIW_002746 [Dictyostelium discoideum]
MAKDKKQNKKSNDETIDDLLDKYKLIFNQYKSSFPEIVERKLVNNKKSFHPYNKNKDNHKEKQNTKKQPQHQKDNHYIEKDENEKSYDQEQFQIKFKEIQDIQFELFELFEINIEILQCQ